MDMLRSSMRFAAARGRHRLGQPGLRHCRALPGVTRRLTANARLDRRQAAFRTTAFAAMTAVLVSGWYTAVGASAIAEMVAH